MNTAQEQTADVIHDALAQATRRLIRLGSGKSAHGRVLDQAAGSMGPDYAAPGEVMGAGTRDEGELEEIQNAVTELAKVAKSRGLADRFAPAFRCLARHIDAVREHTTTRKVEEPTPPVGLDALEEEAREAVRALYLGRSERESDVLDDASELYESLRGFHRDLPAKHIFMQRRLTAARNGLS